MNFAIARPDVVRAINQRWLLKFWQRHLGDLRVPQWQAIEAANLSAMSANLSFLDVIGNGETARFQFRYQGAAVSQIHASDDWRGKYLDEVMPAARQIESLPAYRHAVHSGCPVYTVYDINDRNGCLVHYERLLLPFAHDGQNVDRILASYELISEDGAFDRDALMKTQSTPPILRLAATIELASAA